MSSLVTFGIWLKTSTALMFSSLKKALSIILDGCRFSPISSSPKSAFISLSAFFIASAKNAISFTLIFIFKLTYVLFAGDITISSVSGTLPINASLIFSFITSGFKMLK